MAKYNLNVVSVDAKSNSIDDISSLGKNAYIKDLLYCASKLKDDIYIASKNWDSWCYNNLSCCSMRNNHSIDDNFHFTRESCEIQKRLGGDMHYYYGIDTISFNLISRNFNY